MSSATTPIMQATLDSRRSRATAVRLSTTVSVHASLRAEAEIPPATHSQFFVCVSVHGLLQSTQSSP